MGFFHTLPPHCLVLVQWMGLSPEDSSWEKWDNIATTFHLEDKVNLSRSGIDSESHNFEERPLVWTPTMKSLRGTCPDQFITGIDLVLILFFCYSVENVASAF